MKKDASCVGITEERRQEWDDQIDYCEDFTNMLTDWELGLLDSVLILRDKGEDISRRQSNKLREIARRIENERY